MRILRKNHLPDSIEIGDKVYKPNAVLTARLQQKLSIDSAMLKNCIQVNVLSSNLKGKTDLHGKPYEPTKWIFTWQKVDVIPCNYYKSELDKIEIGKRYFFAPTFKIFANTNGINTNHISLNRESAEVLIQWLQDNFINN